MVSSPSDTSSKKDCQRFYGFGKKIPKDVKRHCGICRQHGLVVETRKHICQFKDCDCWKCKLVRQRRSIMSTQIRLRREQDKKFQRTTDESEADVVPWNTKGDKERKEDLNMCYFCQKCKNHGVLMWKKDHKKNCAYADCRCEQCDLIDTRRALDRHIKKNKQTQDPSSSSEVSISSSPSDVDTPRVPSAKVIITNNMTDGVPSEPTVIAPTPVPSPLMMKPLEQTPQFPLPYSFPLLFNPFLTPMPCVYDNLFMQQMFPIPQMDLQSMFCGLMQMQGTRF